MVTETGQMKCGDLNETLKRFDIQIPKQRGICGWNENLGIIINSNNDNQMIGYLEYNEINDVENKFMQGVS